MKASIGLYKKTGKAISARPKGITTMIYLSIIVGVFLTISGFIYIQLLQNSPFEVEKEIGIIPGYSLGFARVYGFILPPLGITYIALGIGFWRADVWALTLYNYVNCATILVSLIYGTLTVTSPQSQILGQSISIVYFFVVMRYLNNKRVKSYFYQNIVDARLSQYK